MNAHNWIDYRIFATFIVGPEYVTVLSYFKTFEDVVEAVVSHMTEQNKTLLPFVLLSGNSLSDPDANKLKEYDLPSLILE